VGDEAGLAEAAEHEVGGGGEDEDEGDLDEEEREGEAQRLVSEGGTCPAS